MNIDETKVHNDFYKFCHLKQGDLNVLWLYPPVFIYFKHCFNIEHISLLFCEAFPKGDEILKTFAHFPNQFLFSYLKIRNLFYRKLIENSWIHVSLSCVGNSFIPPTVQQ